MPCNTKIYTDISQLFTIYSITLFKFNDISTFNKTSPLQGPQDITNKRATILTTQPSVYSFNARSTSAK